jgi:hypothetical protein
MIPDWLWYGMVIAFVIAVIFGGVDTRPPRE